MIIDNLKNIEFYKSINNDIYEGLKFIAQAPADIAVGTYEITPTAKALVMEYETKLGDNGFGYEAHLHNIDVQYCIRGSERILWSNLGRMKAYTEYDETKDATYYTHIEQQGEVNIGNDIFAVFYPEDAHAPVHCTIAPEPIKKIVIKVSV